MEEPLPPPVESGGEGEAEGEAEEAEAINFSEGGGEVLMEARSEIKAPKERLGLKNVLIDEVF